MDPLTKLIKDYVKIRDKMEPEICKKLNQEYVDTSSFNNEEKYILRKTVSQLKDKFQHLEKKAVYEKAVKDCVVYNRNRLDVLKDSSLLSLSVLNKEIATRNKLGEAYQYDREAGEGREFHFSYLQEESLFQSLKTWVNSMRQSNFCYCRTCILMELSKRVHYFAQENEIRNIPSSWYKMYGWLKGFDMRHCNNISWICSKNCTLS
ncbi:uncharacterized protein [Anoplolepis gracilipes]|uniref:uncharacterized protein n=1 Tax=Anoplolepis gracilipes TaxID=354296 RepID=UPI003BA2462A